MAEFRYQCVDSSGVTVDGQVQAVDRRAAISALTAKGFFATSMEAVIDGVPSTHDGSAGSSVHNYRVSAKDVLAFTSQLHTALQAGLPLLQCLTVIEKQVEKSSFKQLLAELARDVSAGESLSEAMAKHDKSFSTLYLAMIRVGETGGILEQTTGQLADLIKREDQIKTNMKTALSYPICVLFAGIISVIILVTLVLPRIVESIAESTPTLPLPTEILMAMSGFLASYSGLILALILVIVGLAFYQWINSPQGRLKWDGFKLRIPILGKVLLAIAVGRFAQTLGALSKGGITILEALAVVRDTLGNEALARQIDKVSRQVKTGSPLAEPLSESGYFPPLLIQVISVGEHTGRLDEMLLNASVTFDEQANAAINRFTAVLPAALTLILAVIVGFIVAAALMPIMSMDIGMGI